MSEFQKKIWKKQKNFEKNTIKKRQNDEKYIDFLKTTLLLLKYN